MPMPPIPSADLKHRIVDALADVEQTMHRLDAAQKAASDLQRRLDAAAADGLLLPEDPLFTYARVLNGCSHSAAAAAMLVAKRVRQLG
jgi:hypothetical protein